MNKIVLPIGLLLTCLAVLNISASAGDKGGLGDPYAAEFVLALAVTDTVPPPKERFGDYINDKNANPFDLNDPSAIEQNIEYDPATGQYIITEKIGDFDFRPPTYMTFDEYLEYRQKKEEQDYFNRLAGIDTEGTGLSATDPFAQFDVKSSIIDRLFGGTTVDIRPQGGIDLTFGFDIQRLDNPILTERQRTTGGFDFDMDIQMNVTGKIGEKLNLNTNYNTGATFDFDNQIKLDYNSDAFSEDDILKKIEAGNVSLPLRGTLIQGAQSLFGLKTELQFGHLRLTAIASQQKSQRENIQLQGGSQLQEFEVKADEYDENRHFFLSHYNRSTFEGALQNLPQINTLFQIENIEVWITNDRNEVEDVRDIVALADLGEPETLVNPESVPIITPAPYREIYNGKALPDNASNGLFSKLLNRQDGIRNIDRAVAILQSAEFGLQQSRDFEKVSARKLNPREYTLHPELGFISLNINVQPDQVLAVSFAYKYNGKRYSVGEFSNNIDNTSTDTLKQTPKVLFTKMLKSTTQRIDVPTWELMMKNVYSIGAYQVNPQDFRLDVFYEDPGEGLKRFLPSSNLAGRPLIDVFNLDNLNTQGDPQPDGIFDYVTGLTIFPNNGRIMFPVLEPFGSHLRDKLDTDQAIAQYTYPELYSQTLFQAREYPEKNRYVIKGSYKSSVSSEISLGAFNVPPGSVRVTAGGTLLQEGRDYEVDYATGKVRVLNDAILSSGVPINVSYEDNTLFGFQSKTMVGLRADYELGDNFNIGATYLQLFERPFTQKVNLGEDPINNKIYGLDLNFSKELPGLTKVLDAFPLLSTKAPSNLTFSAEAAYLKPGHSRAINESRRDKDGIVYVDDFEGSASSFDLRQPVTQWYMASVPQNDAQNNNPLFPEAQTQGLPYGANRARLNWYRIDPSARGGNDGGSTYYDRVPQQEVFPNIQPTPADPQLFQTFDMAFFPQERGPYNFDVPNGYGNLSRGITSQNDTLILNDPETRWGGIMRALTTNDFQSANIEFLEFWVLSPFHDNRDASMPATDVEGRQGTLYINLGNVSEDILKDSRKFFENGLPTPQNPERPVDTTAWSRVPIGQQITRAFDNDPGTREIQDVGLDGFDNAGEQQQFASYLSALQAFNPIIASQEAQDPSNDDFLYYNDESFSNSDGVRQRYKFFNNPEGNSRSNSDNRIRQSGTNIPDAEDLNQDNTLNETESYFQYEIPLYYDPLNPRQIDRERTPFITDQIEDDASSRIWYRFRIPLSTPLKKSVGGIRDFRSIRFMRMYMRGFHRPTVLRFARLELVRNQWRRYTQDLTSSGVLNTGCDDAETTFDVDAVNIEENSRRTPFNYVLPEGIQRELSLGVFNTLQNEQSLSMRLENVCDGDSRAIFKIIEWDFRLYEELKMFVHAESKNFEVPDGELKLFMRLGSDFKNNYYEYEIPLVMSDPDRILELMPGSPEYKQEVWRPENELNFRLRLLTELKEQRNANNGSPNDEYAATLDGGHVIKVKGNPNLGFVKMAMIGVRNPKNDGVSYSTEIWANELRLVGLDERGGAAALARADIQLADFGNVTVAGNFNSIGFGALDAGVHQRSRERVTGYDLATNLELGKLLPEKLGLSVPFFAQLSNTTKTPEYDPYDLDLLLDEKVKNAQTQEQRDSIKTQAQEVTQIKTMNFTNVRKERTGNGKPMPWDISNVSVSYSQSEIEYRDPIIEFQREKKYTGIVDYSYSRGGGFIEPFKSLPNSQFLRLIKEFNFNPLPNSFNFSSILDRKFADTRYRFAGDPRYTTYFNKRFTWERNYDLQWNITKSLQLSFTARSFSVIDEPDERAMREDPTITDINKYRRDSILTNLRNLGRPKNYDHSINVSYTLPLRYLPFMDWMQVRAQYQAGYSWNAAALNVDSLGNIIQNNQIRQVTADLNFEKLYDGIPYLKKINRGNQPARGRNTNPRDNNRQTPNIPPSADEKKNDREPSVIEKVLIRPLLLVRKARLNYKENFATVVPGFMPVTKLMGLSSGFDAPGWDFVAGLQPKIRTLSDEIRNNPREGAGDWLYDNRNWITRNVFLNQDVVQEYTQEYGGRLTLEPFTDFRIDIDADRKFTENYTETFKVFDTTPGAEFGHAPPLYQGSMTVSYNALNTLFRNDDEVLELFRNFEDNRVVISQRLGTGLHEDPNLAAQGYTDGYGRNQQEVLIPAFISTYTGQDPRTFNMNLFDTKPFPNWRASYNGLSKLPIFRDIFSNFNITHGYQSALTVNSYRTSSLYLRGLEENNTLDTTTYNYYAKLEIPDVVIQEGFSPLLGVEATLQNGMSFSFDYQQQRTLALNVTNTLLSETRSKKIDFGFGYLMRNVDIPFLTGSNKKGNKKAEDTPAPTTTPNRGGNRPSQLQGQDLDIQFTFSLADDLTLAQKLDAGFSEPTRGNNVLQFSPSAEYKLNRRLSLRLFFDYRRTIPKTSAGFPRLDTSGGVVVRFQLN
ncbi:MAG: cell surface protein SprA [Saprospiraceae bacterium]|nr:cell surface protein SprA [Lewinella sp.]